MTQTDRDVATILRNPAWLPHRYDPERDTVHFIDADRRVLRTATFLTDEYLPGALQPLVLNRSAAVTNAPRPAPLHFIFHSAYCCSTLLARALDRDGIAVALKEPVILNDLIGWGHRGGDPEHVARILNDVLTLLARPFASGETVIVKPSNVTNALAPAALAMRPDSRVLLLHAPLRTYLGSIARKGMWGRLWVRDLLVKLIRDGLVPFGFDMEAYIAHTDLQAAAIGWLTQHALFMRLVETYGADRIRTLDSETLIDRPNATLAALATLFGLSLDAGTIAGIVVGPAFTRHSKTAVPFGRETRATEQDEAAPYRDEIDKIVHWAEVVADSAGIPMRLEAPLLGAG